LPGTGTTTSTATSKAATTTASKVTTGTTSAPTTSATPVAGNPYTGYTVALNPFYVNEVTTAAANITNSALAAKAIEVSKVPNFFWIDQVAKIPILQTYLAAAAAAGSNQLAQIVIYDLPDRDCAAKASNGEFTVQDGGQALYFNYIDQIVAIIKQYPTVRVVAVIEPDSLANLVTNLSVAECSAAEATYKACVTYALQQLSSVGVYQYMDAGHAGWLGWPANLQPAATLFAQMFVAGGSSKFIRGLATNVANYNALVAATPDPITYQDGVDPNYDEMLYITNLSPLLDSAGFPAQFIIDQGRSGVQDIRVLWGDWCNIKGAGFGLRPGTSPGSALIDQIVWVKPGGECDGTSNSSSPRYDPTCSLSDAFQPAPEAGSWFEAYFESLITNANPAF